MFLSLAANAIRSRLRRAMLALTQPPAHSDREDSEVVYRFPFF